MNPSDDPREIEKQLAIKRADVSATIQQLEKKISPDQVMDQGLDIIRDHGADLMSTLGQSFKQNPAPFVVSGIALTWLAIASSRKLSPDNLELSRRPANSAQNSAHTPGQSSTESSTNIDADLLDELGQALDDLSSSSSDIKDDVKAKYAQLREMASTQSGKLRDISKIHAETAMQSAIKPKSSKASPVLTTQNYLKSQPLLAGLVSFVIGTVLGSLIPKSEFEEKLMGPKSEKLAEQANKGIDSGSDNSQNNA